MNLAANAAISTDCIRVRGARTHNLQNVDIDIPRGELVVITGVSGSGKSSLAFDTLFAEGQRRYLETLSTQARAWLDQMQRPDVDEIDGLPPVLSIEQRGGAVNPRSTLATTTEIHDFLRLLYARAGTAHCPNCGRVLSQQSTQSIVDGILALEAGRKVMIVAPLVRAKKGTHRELFERIVRDGFVRARVDGAIVDASSPPDLKKSKSHDIEVIIDRIVVKEGLRARLFESVELALRHGNGACIISHEEDSQWSDRLFSSRFACPECELSFPEVEPRTFSFNSPYGACPTCQGLGVVSASFDGRPGQSAGAGAIADRSDREICPDCHGARLGPVGRAVTFAGWPIHKLLALTVTEAESLIPRLLSQLSKSEIQNSKSEISSPARLVAERILPEVHNRLRYLCEVGVGYLALDRPAQTLSGGEFQRARIAGCLGSGLIGVCYILDEPTIGLHPRDTRRLLDTLLALRARGNSLIVVEHDVDIMARADYLIDLGPGAGREGGRVVAQGRPAEVADDERSLTGRSLQRRLTRSQAADSNRSRRKRRPVDLAHCLLLKGAAAHNLKDLDVAFPLGTMTAVTGVSGSGKSTLVMETLVPRVRAALAQRQAPGAGTLPLPLGEGRGEGRAGASVRPDAGPLAAPVPRPRKAGRGNLAHRAVDVPAQQSAIESISPNLPGIEHIDRLVEIDQSPLGRNARSNPATASGMWDEIRRIFARTRDARVRGFRSGRFSFNAAGGRCEECRGRGTRHLAMQFLPDIEITCPVCRGARFNRQTLEVKFRGKSVADVLDMRIDDSAAFFANIAVLASKLHTFVDVGLGYLTLGQSATTLSGGEAQRIKLATELSRPQTGMAPAARTLYVLDEPTTGLHPADIARLVDLLDRLAEAGNTVIVIEHQLDVIAASDWVIDLGPEGGSAGGRLVAEGPPEQIAAASESHTGQALRGPRECGQTCLDNLGDE
jgi:excinuclease ABC subunit A